MGSNSISEMIQELVSEINKSKRQYSPIPSSRSKCTNTETTLQVTSCRKRYEDGSLPPIRGVITTLDGMLTRKEQQGGLSKARLSLNGSQPDLFCGFTENVRNSYFCEFH